MRKIEAKIVADSVNPQGNRITTFLLTFPRFILSELNTHRVFSKNSASSRAIPFEKMVKMVEEDPFIPIAWQKHHSGMQGNEYVENPNYCVQEWLKTRDLVIEQAERLYTGSGIDNGTAYDGQPQVTKQLCNRLLEPFMWHTVLLTATEFDNFFKLRCPSYYGFSKNGEKVSFRSKKDVRKHFEELKLDTDLVDNQSFKSWQSINTSQAEIHMQALAEAMWDAMNESTPKELKEGEWHIPFGDKMQDRDIMQHVKGNFNSRTEVEEAIQKFKIKIAVARCARLSYMTFDGKVDYEKDLKLHDSLLKSGHMSPFEHCARAMTNLEYYSFIKGKVPTQRDEYGILNYEYYPYSDGVTNRDGVFWVGFNEANPNNGDRFGWCNNFRGFIQYRYLIENKS